MQGHSASSFGSNTMKTAVLVVAALVALASAKVAPPLQAQDIQANTVSSNALIVMAQPPRLNHKVFSARVNVGSDFHQKVDVRFFLAPNQDRKRREILLSENTDNFYEFDQFKYQLKEGDNTIVHTWTDKKVKDLTSEYDIYEEVKAALSGQEFVYMNQEIDEFPLRLLPEGSIEDMLFVLVVVISE